MSVLLLRTVLVYFSLILFFRLTGKRQIGQLELSELIIALLISELATIAIADLRISLLHTLLPVALLVCLEIIFSFLATKATIFKRFFDGSPSILIQNGIPCRRELGRARISVEELLSQMRLKGYSHLTDISYAFLEHNGQISFLPAALYAPPAAKDLGVDVEENEIPYTVLVDGKINRKSLTLFGKDEQWLINLLAKKGLSVSQIFLCILEQNGDPIIITQAQSEQIGEGVA